MERNSSKHNDDMIDSYSFTPTILWSNWGQELKFFVFECKCKYPAVQIVMSPIQTSNSDIIVRRSNADTAKKNFFVSGKEDTCHVLSFRNELYNAVLGMVDLVRGTNSYYKVQVLKHDTKKNKYAFLSSLITFFQSVIF